MLITVDTGGTKTLIAAFNHKGAVVRDTKFPTPRDVSEYIDLVTSTIRELCGDETPSAICIALPGIIKNNVAAWCPNLGWHDEPIYQLMKRRFDCPIFVENDANLAGLAEAKSLPKKLDNILYVTISTGIGMGLIIDHKIHPALTITEPGHMLLEYDGKLREWESFGSGRSIKETYGKFAADIHSVRTWSQIADKISRGFLVLIPVISPDMIIIGGSIGTYFDRYEAILNRILRDKLPETITIPPIRQAIHPEEAVVYGCYYHALNQLAD